ncbi:MAG: AAHS family 4-hydroxybenzoate transporter-like MFS transporter, partial [Gammaproteobacteria bacterium]
MSVIVVGSLSIFSSSVGLAMMLIVPAGAGIVGGQFCINALSVSIYPTAARATGIGWALGIGRFGAILSPLIAAQLVAPDTIQTYFMIGALPSFICAAGVFYLKNDFDRLET